MTTMSVGAQVIDISMLSWGARFAIIPTSRDNQKPTLQDSTFLRVAEETQIPGSYVPEIVPKIARDDLSRPSESPGVGDSQIPRE